MDHGVHELFVLRLKFIYLIQFHSSYPHLRLATTRSHFKQPLECKHLDQAHCADQAGVHHGPCVDHTDDGLQSFCVFGCLIIIFDTLLKQKY